MKSSRWQRLRTSSILAAIAAGVGVAQFWVAPASSAPLPARTAIGAVDSSEQTAGSDDPQWLATLAQEFNLSTAEVKARYGWSDEFAAALESVKDRFPGQYASGNVHTDGEPGATVRFTGEVPADASDIFASVPARVTLVGGAKHTEAVALRAVPKAHYAVRRALQGRGHSTDQLTSVYDPETGTIDVNLLGEELGALSSGDRAELGHIAQNAAAQAGHEVPTVRIVSDAGGYSSETAVVRGGGVLSTCTSGFPVIDTNTSVRGIITADHCQRSQLYEGRNILTYRRSIAPSRGDISFYQSSETVQASFWFSQQDYRFIQGNRSPYLGQPVCKYGKTTHQTCDTVHAFGHCADGYCNLVQTANHKNDLGDSGGPWYENAHAVGIMHGYACTFGICRDSFSYTRDNIGPYLSVNILQN